MINADYADDPMLLANTPAQAASLLHSLEQVAGGISLYMNINQSKCVLKKQASEISSAVHIARQQYLIDRKQCRPLHKKGMNCYGQVISNMEIRSL